MLKDLFSLIIKLLINAIQTCWYGCMFEKFTLLVASQELLFLTPLAWQEEQLLFLFEFLKETTREMLGTCI